MRTHRKHSVVVCNITTKFSRNLSETHPDGKNEDKSMFVLSIRSFKDAEKP